MNAPRRPGEIPHSVSLAQLADRYNHTVLRLLEHRHGLRPLTRPEMAGDALSALAFCTALAERAQGGRWSTAVDALAAGASVEHTAAAMGMDVDELRSGLTAWADRQHRLGLIDSDQHALVTTLLRGEGQP